MHNEIEGEWLNLVEFHAIDLFSFRLWGETPDAAAALSSGLDRKVSFNRRVAYEIKTNRSDLLRELRRPKKRALGLAFSHQFYFATTPGLMRPHELPPECGLVEVNTDGSVKSVKVVTVAPMRKPSHEFATGDIVTLLRAKHIGTDARQYREQARVAAGLLRETEAEHLRAQRLLGRARLVMLREKRGALVVGSEWLGPWPLRREKQHETRVAVTHVSVADPERFDGFDHLRVGTVYAQPVDRREPPDWLDAGDFLISFLPVESGPRLVAPLEAAQLDMTG